MVAAATLTDAPAAADETPAPKPMKITVKVSFAWSAHASMDHLVHHRELETPDDGSETLASFKQRFADAEGVPVEYVQFLWFDRPIGRRFMNRPRPEKEAQTLGELGVTRWLAKFPNWRGALKATIADDEPMSHLEQVHRSVAIVHKGMKDGSKKLDRYINVKKKKSSWNTLVYGAPTPWDDRYPETMPDE